MTPFVELVGRAAPLPLANVDTDVIIRIEASVDRQNLGRHAFAPLRYNSDGSERAEFPPNQPAFRGAPILIAGANFGCGSSRETAVWAIQGMGFRCVIAESFGDIFYSNCFQNGFLPIRLSEAAVTDLMAQAQAGAGDFKIDLAGQVVTTPNGTPYRFDIDPLRREGLLEGLDDVGFTLKQMSLIRSWQARDREERPWVWATSGLRKTTA